MGLWRADPDPGIVIAVTESVTPADRPNTKENLMNWTYLNAPSYKFVNLHQDAFALALGGNATATNVAVQTVG